MSIFAVPGFPSALWRHARGSRSVLRALPSCSHRHLSSTGSASIVESDSVEPDQDGPVDTKPENAESKNVSLSSAGTGPVRWNVEPEECGSRLDRFVKRRAPGLPPGLIQRLIRQRRVVVDGVPAIRNAHPVEGGNLVEFPGDIKLGLSRAKKRPKSDDVSLREAEYIRELVIHRDARCVVLNKPAGLATQGGTGLGDRHVEALLPGLGAGRYFLVHRLDKEVSGALAVARDVGAAAELARSFRDRHVEKIYWALVAGRMPAFGGRVKMDVDGRRAETDFRVVRNLDGFGAWVALRPRTGRKHQLRVHCAVALKCPIVGEVRYDERGERPMGLPAAGSGAYGLASMLDDCGLHLHARELSFPKLTSVGGGGRRRRDVSRVSVRAPLPAHMRTTWRRLGLHEGGGDDVGWEGVHAREF